MISLFLFLFLLFFRVEITPFARRSRLDDSNVAQRKRGGEMEVSYSTSEYIVSRDVSALHRYGTALLSGGAQRIRADRSKISLLRSLKRSPGGQDLTVDRCSPAKMLRSRWAKRRL